MRQIDTIERNKRILELAKEQHLTVAQIAELLQLRKTRISQILRAYNVKAVRPSHDLESKIPQKIISELKAGTKQSDIARKLNVSRQYVSQVKYKMKKIDIED